VTEFMRVLGAGYPEGEVAWFNYLFMSTNPIDVRFLAILGNSRYLRRSAFSERF
jgi:hypothetical protein